MVKWIVQKSLLEAFRGSFVNHNGEFIASKRENEYFNLVTCNDILDVQCKILEWLSRGACKTQPYFTDKANKNFHDRMREGINRFLGTNFTHEDMRVIYDRLGNSVNHPLTLEFVRSGYDMDLLRKEE